MKNLDLFDLRQNFHEKGILICFVGQFSHSIIEEIGMAIKRYLESEDLHKSAVMDVFAVFIEQAQNVRNYTIKKDWASNPDLSSSILMIGRIGEKYAISSGNLVEKNDIGPVLEQLKLVSSLDKQQLKALYKDQKRKAIPAGSSGSGLGLIDIARRATQPFTYSVKEIDEKHSFFSLTVLV